MCVKGIPEDGDHLARSLPVSEGHFRSRRIEAMDEQDQQGL